MNKTDCRLAFSFKHRRVEARVELSAPVRLGMIATAQSFGEEMIITTLHKET
jgi:hypothetical protein